MIFAPAVLAAGLAIMLGGVSYDATRPPMTGLERFIHYQTPDETDMWVHWQQRGYFAGHEKDEAIGRGLLLLRGELHHALVDRGKMGEAQFDSRYGTSATPNYCALSKEAIAMSFGSSASVWKFSRCKV